MYMDFWWLAVIVVTVALGAGASAYVKLQLKKYEKVASASGITGREAAERMLAANGVRGVAIMRGKENQDHFDPKTNSIALSPSVYDRCSVTAYATACHEVGHACQFAQGYGPLKTRTAFWPIANAASNAWVFVLLLGIFMGATTIGGVCITIAIVMYACVVLFQLITLPVEFNASSRALAYMQTVGLPQSEVDGGKSVLRACAFTYVAAALSSLLYLVYLLSRNR